MKDNIAGDAREETNSFYETSRYNMTASRYRLALQTPLDDASFIIVHGEEALAMERNPLQNHLLCHKS